MATPSLFQPFAEAIRDGHRIAYNLPASKPAQPAPTREITPDERALESAREHIEAFYDRPNGYSGD